MKTSYKLVDLTADLVITCESTKDVCRTIDDLGIEEGEYYILECKSQIEQYLIKQELQAYRHSKKNKQKGDVDVEPITIKGEIKDDPSQEVQRNGQGLRLPEHPNVLPERKPGNKKNK
jgi:hypothetical protein